MAATRAVHVLTTIPLTDARGKTDVARELMLWPGARDYYRVGAGHRYLAVRGGVLSTSSPHHFHEWRWVNAALTELIWLARVTGRVLLGVESNLQAPHVNSVEVGGAITHTGPGLAAHF